MKEPNYKLVCWNDYSIPVPIDAKWLAMDKNGDWYAYWDKPKAHHKGLYAGTFILADWLNITVKHMFVIDKRINIDPPEPGPWHTQCYWIGD